MYPVAVSLAAHYTEPAATQAKTPVPITRSAPRTATNGKQTIKNKMVFQMKEQQQVSWAPGGIAKKPAKKEVALKIPIPKQSVAFVLPQLPVKPTGGYKFGKNGFQPLPPLTVVPHNLKLPPASPLATTAATKAVVAKAVPAKPASAPQPKVEAPDFSYPLTALSEEQPLKGMNRAVASVIQELATREKLKVVIGPTGEKKVTIHLGDVEPEVALKQVTNIAGLSLRKHEGVWYVATPDWMAKAFPERQYTKLVQLPTDDAAALANALEKVLGGGTKVEAVSGSHLIVRAPVSELETAAYVLAQWPAQDSGSSPVASLALDLPEGTDASLFRLAGMKDDQLTVEQTDKTESVILRGSPMAVLGGLKTYVAATGRNRIPSVTVARRTDKK